MEQTFRKAAVGVEGNGEFNGWRVSALLDEVLELGGTQLYVQPY